MHRSISLIAGSLVALAACARNPQVQAGGEVAPATPVNARWLPAGTTLNARLNQSLSASSSREGDQFTATVTDPVIAQNGVTAVPAGAVLTGHITGLHSASIPGEQSVIRLDFDNLTFNGNTYPFDGSVASVNVANQGVTSSSTARSAATGAAAGAVLGAIVGGASLSKIIEGGLIGAAAGTVISLGTGGGNGNALPSGSTLQVRATQAVQIR